jgi:hypothetical protein
VLSVAVTALTFGLSRLSVAFLPQTPAFCNFVHRNAKKCVKETRFDSRIPYV